MIQPLKSSRTTWTLHWVDLEEPVPTGNDFILPTLLIICDAGGLPVSSPTLLEELDQNRIENLLLRLFDTLGAPDRLNIGMSEDWDQESWRAFSEEQSVEIRFHRGTDSGPEDMKALALSVVQRFAGGDGAPGAAAIAKGLLNTAMRVRSARKKEALLRMALERDSEFAAARVELADVEFQKGNWKTCLGLYDQVISSEKNRWKNRHPHWWEDRTTRPYLRALYGRAMTLWHRGRHSETAEQLAFLLDLNPRDNQGVRFFIPLLYLLAEDIESASAAFAAYEKTYPRDYPEPSLLFGWALCCSLEGEEAAARSKYREGILKNLFIAPMLLEEPSPPRALWLPNDRSEPNYASEFTDSYAVLWDRESGALRILREVWHEMQDDIAELIAHRERMFDFQDQRYEPDFKKLWQAFLDVDDRLSGSSSQPV
jgi:tetratricopeptide (TPR) repeat protein